MQTADYSISAMCGNWLSGNRYVKRVTLKEESGKSILMQGNDKSWYPTRKDGRCNVEVVAAQEVQWTIWQHEKFYVMFSESVKGKTRFLKRGKRDRLILSSEGEDTSTQNVKITDARMFMVVGDYKSNCFSLKHCDCQFNVTVDKNNLLVLSTEHMHNWEIREHETQL